MGITKDQRIINQHPDATPYELWQEHGLSEAKYLQMMAEQGKDGKKEANEKVSDVIPPEDNDTSGEEVKTDEPPVKQKATASITIDKPNVAAPKLQSAKAPKIPEGQAFLVNNTTGKRTKMSRGAAESWAKRHAGQYTVI